MIVTTLSFLIALTILVFVHEWGHFIVAKLAGIRVEIFSIGFGPKLLGLRWHGTEYRIAPIPFGGYVKIFGQEPLEEAQGDVQKAKEIAEHPESFAAKPLHKRLAVVFAGPFMNVVLCAVVLPLVFLVGKMESKELLQKPVVVAVTLNSPAARAGLKIGDEILSIDETRVSSWRDLRTEITLHANQEVILLVRRAGVEQKVAVVTSQLAGVKQPIGYLGVEDFIGNEPLVGMVMRGGAAFNAGVKKGDLVLSVNDKPIQFWTEMTDLIQKLQGKEVTLSVKRGGNSLSLAMLPLFDSTSGRYLIGIEKGYDPAKLVHKRYGLTESLTLGGQEFVRLFGLTLDILGRLFTGNLSLKVLGGPLQIAQATSSAYQSGLGEFLFILAFLSLQLGVLNLLPIPVLDGGHVLFMGIEGLLSKPLPLKVRTVTMQLGLFLLLSMMVLVTINDVNTMWGESAFIKSLKNLF